jgi:hypothetical protein
MPKAVSLPPRKCVALALGLSLLPAACKSQKSSGSVASAAKAAPAPSAAHRPQSAASARENRQIPAGALRAGSTPGDAGRVPELEPKNQELELGPFGIDRLPYPNDPSQPPLLGKTRDEARRLCAERSARLCTEVEWERACKGPRQDEFPSGVIWDPSCIADVQSCATGFDVLGLGTVAAEWVANDVTNDEKRRALVRGAAKGAPATDHRCAARHPTEASTQSQDIGFRCCQGPPNAAVLAEPKQGPVFTKLKLSAEELAQMLAADPAGKALAHDIKFFRDPEGANTVVSRGPGEKKGFDYGTRPPAPRSCWSRRAPATRPPSSPPFTCCRAATTGWRRPSRCKTSPAQSR